MHLTSYSCAICNLDVGETMYHLFSSVHLVKHAGTLLASPGI
jgi:hypothetical protein